MSQALFGRPAAKAAQVLSSHIVVDMHAKAIRGMPARGGRDVGGASAADHLRVADRRSRAVLDAARP